ncbi:MAG: hypothetical protein ABJL55_04360 [Roseibium sp.]
MAASFVASILLVCSVLIAPVQSNAQTADGSTVAETPEALLVRQSSLLQQMISDPANLDVAFEYAMVSSLLGDYEAAIGTFERILVFAPGLAQTQLELGVLYYRLGSIPIARFYFEQTLKASELPDGVRAKAETYLASITELEDPAEFRAMVVAGVRYQSNANAAPGSRRVDLNGGSFVLDDTGVGSPDVNAFLAGRVHGAYDLGTQGDLIEADLVYYGARYADIVRLDSALAELTLGPSLNLERFDIDDSRLGLYAIAAGVRLNRANYNGALGFGARLVSQITPSFLVDSKIEWRRRWYKDTGEYPTVSDRNGSYWRLATTISKSVNRDVVLRSLILADFEETATAATQHWEVGGGIGVNYLFASPIDRLPYKWSIDLEAGYLFRQYEGPDPVVSTTETEFNYEGWVRSGLSVPLREDIALGLVGEFRRQYSNYDLSTYSNASALVSLSKSF